MTDTTELVVPKSIPMILLILPSISRLRIRLVLACNHYQTLVCYCQADMSRSSVMCPPATSECPRFAMGGWPSPKSLWRTHSCVPRSHSCERWPSRLAYHWHRPHLPLTRVT